MWRGSGTAERPAGRTAPPPGPPSSCGPSSYNLNYGVRLAVVLPCSFPPRQLLLPAPVSEVMQNRHRLPASAHRGAAGHRQPAPGRPFVGHSRLRLPQRPVKSGNNSGGAVACPERVVVENNTLGDDDPIGYGDNDLKMEHGDRNQKLFRFYLAQVHYWMLTANRSLQLEEREHVVMLTSRFQLMRCHLKGREIR